MKIKVHVIEFMTEDEDTELPCFWKFSVYVPILSVLFSMGTLLTVAIQMAQYQNISVTDVICTKWISYNLGASYYTGLAGNTFSAAAIIATYLLVWIYNKRSGYAIYGRVWGNFLVIIGMIPPVCLWLLTLFNIDMMQVPKIWHEGKGRYIRDFESMPEHRKNVWWWHVQFMKCCFTSFAIYECFTTLAFLIRLRRTKERQTKANWTVFGYMCFCLVGFFVMSFFDSPKLRTRIFQTLCVFCIWVYSLSFSYIFYDLLYAEGSTLFHRKETEDKLEPQVAKDEDGEEKQIEL